MHQAVSAFRRAGTAICLVIALSFICRAAIALSVADTSSSSAASASGTTIPPATQIIDSSGNTWTVSGGIVYENGSLTEASANAELLVYENGTIYGETTAGAWYSWNGSTWIPSSDPRGSGGGGSGGGGSGGGGSGGTGGVSAPTNVDLNSYYNVNAIADPGTAPANGGVDTSSFAFASNLLGSSVSYAGMTFHFGWDAGPTAVAAATIALPAGQYPTLNILATGVYGPTTDLVFTITYTDGTSTSFTQSVSSWGTPQDYPGESTVVSTAYRVTPTGDTQAGPWSIYGYTFALDSTKTVQSLTLPNTRLAVVFGVAFGGSAGGGSTGGTGGTGGGSTGSATVSWSTPTLNTDGTALTDLAGYTVYYGTSSTALTETFRIPNPAATNCVIRNLSATTYYFAITAYSTLGIESADSSVASMAIAPVSSP